MRVHRIEMVFERVESTRLARGERPPESVQGGVPDLCRKVGKGQRVVSQIRPE